MIQASCLVVSSQLPRLLSTLTSYESALTMAYCRKHLRWRQRVAPIWRHKHKYLKGSMTTHLFSKTTVEGPLPLPPRSYNLPRNGLLTRLTVLSMNWLLWSKSQIQFKKKKKGWGLVTSIISLLKLFKPQHSLLYLHITRPPFFHTLSRSLSASLPLQILS